MTDKYKTVAIDADGTILNYDGWKGVGNFGEPLPGAREAIKELKQSGYSIIIFTTRGSDSDDLRRWLIKYDIPFDGLNQNLPTAPKNISDKKVIATVYIDDRAIPFEGSWKGMVEKVKAFKPWYQKVNMRPSLNIKVAGYYVDQVSLYVQNIHNSIDAYSKLGHPNWIQDEVRAYEWLTNKEFIVSLAFNYTVMPCEFELLQIKAGSTVQIPEVLCYNSEFDAGLSHFGFHVDDLDEAIEAFRKKSYLVLSDVETLNHSGCPDTYKYTFIDTSVLGFISKLIIKA